MLASLALSGRACARTARPKRLKPPSPRSNSLRAKPRRNRALLAERGLSSPQQLANEPWLTFSARRSIGHCCGLESPRSGFAPRHVSVAFGFDDLKFAECWLFGVCAVRAH